MTNPLIIDGKAYAENMHSLISRRVEKLKNDNNITPGLAVILVGDNPASQIYVKNKSTKTRSAGMKSFEYIFPSATTEDEVLAKIKDLNNDNRVHGILVQLPLPKHINEIKVINAISPEKDVDGFHILNAGKLATGQKSTIPCTPKGCILLLKSILNRLDGLHAVVIGRSNIVGKPMAQLLLNENCTVTITHSKTHNLKEECARADIVVAAVGIPQLVKSDWLKKDAVVIDVGINRIKDQHGNQKLVGDVDFEAALTKVKAITPVPGGVGPMTIACLLENTLEAAEKLVENNNS